MLVKIVRITNNQRWYSDKLGETFEVINVLKGSGWYPLVTKEDYFLNKKDVIKIGNPSRIEVDINVQNED